MTEGEAVVASGKPEAFSVADFCRLAEAHAVGSAEFNDLMDLAGRLYPDSPVACINAAGVALLRRDTERARRYLQRFATLPEAGCNMGILCLLEGDQGKAEVYLSLAQAGGSVPAGGHCASCKVSKGSPQNTQIHTESFFLSVWLHLVKYE